ncbi:metal-binding protein [Methyloceanibacter methanicus]|uniref:Metal-binding protein n=1 Tax=Methyloceanibacter methanicus TaxID=1774968 RepID=A0A1E3W115_9HYPH|nr:metal-binding protein [Methyloceanibacter methanicus]
MVLFLATLSLAALALGGPAFAAPDARLAIEIWKSPTCGCCQKWADYLTSNGFSVSARNTTQGMLNRIKRQAGIEPKLASCHTGLIEGYTIEGHVPADDIKRLLAERPDAVGLSVPDMPLGSPGMEQPDGKSEPYDVLLVKKDGSTEIFAKH